MGFMESLSISASGMTAERLRMDVIANNIANAETTQTPAGGPFRRQEVLLASGGASFADRLSGLLGNGDASASLHGVSVTGIVPDNSPFKQVYDPGHPDADAQGYVNMPNVDTVTEMVDMMSATRAYEADATAVEAVKSMATEAIAIGKA
jgi:flagellar basal-body rod protein FlgC